MKSRAWLFLTPLLILVSLNAFIPLMTVVNYSLHFVFAGSVPDYCGLDNYLEVLADPDFRGALKRQVILSSFILLVEIPLGVLIALGLPKKGIGVTIALVLLGIPLLIPHAVVAVVWRLITQSDIGVLPKILNFFHYEYNVALDAVDAVSTIFFLDVWHWTPLVVLLSYAGLRAIPDAYYQAAAIDGASRWRTFWYVTLPKLRSVLIIGVLLRFMDSFTIYSEPMVLTGGGPGNATTFLNLFVARKAESFEMGYAGAVSLVYLIIVIVFCFIFYQFMMNVGKEEQR